jgi:hypothetical protein
MFGADVLRDALCARIGSLTNLHSRDRLALMTVEGDLLRERSMRPHWHLAGVGAVFGRGILGGRGFNTPWRGGG